LADDRQSILEKLDSGLFWCRSCGEAHRGLFDLACIAPAAWPGSRAYRPIGELRLDSTFLSSDFAVCEGRYFFVRCTLDIPVEGLPRAFGFGCWALLTKADFLAYWDDFDNMEPASPEPWAGLLANDLPPYWGCTNLDCAVRVQPSRNRPKIELLGDAHPLALAQRRGIAVEEMLAIYRASGHEID
jgi:hypothetical protein